MARVTLTLYAVADGNPLVGATIGNPGVHFNSLRRINADESVTDLTGSAPTFVEVGGGDYEAVIDDSVILPGSLVRWIVDASAAASSRFYDGEVDGSNPSATTLSAVSPVVGSAIVLSAGDRAPSQLFQCVDPNGSPRDLSTGGAAVTFSMRPSPDGSTPTIDALACTIVDAANGMVLMAWPSGSTDAAGLYVAQFLCTQGGLQTTFPIGASLVVRIVPTI